MSTFIGYALLTIGCLLPGFGVAAVAIYVARREEQQK